MPLLGVSESPSTIGLLPVPWSTGLGESTTVTVTGIEEDMLYSSSLNRDIDLDENSLSLNFINSAHAQL